MASKPVRILFIGNSYTSRNDLPALLTQLAASAPKPIQLQTRMIIAGGAQLKMHWNKGIAAKVIDEGWDYVVLQEQSTLPWKSPQRMHESVRLFDERIKAAGAKTVLYMTWARADDAGRQQAITEAYVSIGGELKARVAPVGLAWQHVLKKHPEIPLHDDDQSHPTAAGSRLAACVFLATLFDQMPAPDPQTKELQSAAIQAVKQLKKML